jgi:hypothetical protein
LGTVFLNKNKILPFHPPLEGETVLFIPINKILPLNPPPKGERHALIPNNKILPPCPPKGEMPTMSPNQNILPLRRGERGEEKLKERGKKSIWVGK